MKYQGYVEGQDYHKIQVRFGDGAGAGLQNNIAEKRLPPNCEKQNGGCFIHAYYLLE